MEFEITKGSKSSSCKRTKVLILVLMEFEITNKCSLGKGTCQSLNPCFNGIWDNDDLQYCETLKPVLTLVLMEFEITQYNTTSNEKSKSVLILVLMEFEITHICHEQDGYSGCLNPCFNGIWDNKKRRKKSRSVKPRLNPCFNGIWDNTQRVASRYSMLES